MLPGFSTAGSWCLAACASRLPPSASFKTRSPPLSSPVPQSSTSPARCLRSIPPFHLCGLLMAPIWGEFFKDHRFKNVMLVGCLIIGACMFGYSMAKNVYWFYVIGSVKGLFQGMLIGVPIPKILSNWFVEKRGLAMGLALAGSGLAGSVMTPSSRPPSRAPLARRLRAACRCLPRHHGARHPLPHQGDPRGDGATGPLGRLAARRPGGR